MKQHDFSTFKALTDQTLQRNPHQTIETAISKVEQFLEQELTIEQRLALVNLIKEHYC